MNTVLLTAGVVALMAAVIGGGLKAFNIEIRVLSSRAVRFALGLLGVAFLVAAVALRDDGGGGNEAQDRYQRQVVATCNGVRAVVARDDPGTPQVAPGGITYDRDTFISRGRTNLAAIERRFALLLDKPAPDSLRSEADTVRDRTQDFGSQNRRIFSELQRALPSTFTLERFDTAARPLQDRADNVLARLEDAMTQLAGRDCRLSSS